MLSFGLLSARGSSGSFTVNVVDTIAPQLTVPATTLVFEATSADGATATYSASVLDAVDTAVAVTCSPASGSRFALGTTSVLCEATDFSGNYASAGFAVLVEDTTAPVVTVPGAMLVEATSAAGAQVNYGVTASDAVDAELALSCDPPPGITYPLGTTLVQCLASDDYANVGSASFTVTVADSTAPALALPDPISVEALSPEGTVVTFTALASDAVDSSVAVACVPASGSTFAIGETVVTCTATDAYDNATTGDFTVAVVDTTPPVLTVPEDMVVAAETGDGAYVDYLVSASDVADVDVAISCTPPSGGFFADGTTSVNCTATDDAGNATSGSFSVLVREEIIWITPVEDPYSASIGPNLNLRWGYGANGQLEDSGDMLDTPTGKGTAPVQIYYLGTSCESGAPQVVDLDAGKSSLRYSQQEWQLNWQTGQSLLNGGSLVAGCYLVDIPRAEGRGAADTKRILLSD